MRTVITKVLSKRQDLCLRKQAQLRFGASVRQGEHFLPAMLTLQRFLVFLQGIHGLPGKGDQSDHIENGHQADSDVSQVPDKRISSQSANKEHHQSKNFVQGL